MEYQKLIELLKGHRAFLQTHDFPDPDALASAYGLQQFLLAHGVDTTICYAGAVEKVSTKRMFDVFGIEAHHIRELPDMTESDYIVTVDAQKFNSNITDFIGDEVGCVDHHPATTPCTFAYTDIRICGACSSLVTEYFMKSKTPMDQNTATALLYGLKMDTDSFNRGVTDLDIEAYSFLNRLADTQKITSLYNNKMELDDLYAYGDAIRNIKIYNNVGIAKITFDCPDALIAMVSDFILCLDVVEFSVIYSTRNGGYKFSVRNETDYLHAGSITAEALSDLGGGGGHFSMAGGMISADKVSLLGEHPDDSIRERFLKIIYRIEKERHEKK